MPDTVIAELAAELAEIAASDENRRRAKLWRRHFACEKQAKAPVKITLYMGWHGTVWQRLFPESEIVSEDGRARNIETQLRQKIWKFRNIPDDDYLWPTVWMKPDRKREADSMWGVPLDVTRPDEAGGAYKEVPPLVDEADIDKLTFPEPVPVPDEEAALIAEVDEMTGGAVSARIICDEIGNSPYETAVRLRGASALLYDFYDRPEFVHRLMDHITEGFVGYHRKREELGMVEFQEGMRNHEPYDDPPAGAEGKLSGCWAYVSAQSSATLGPDMYAEFVQPYNARLAKLYWKVYYHGCEDLGQKAETIRELPNLVHFHVSPWTSLDDVRPHLEGRPLALEVHSHPTNVLFSFTADQIRTELQDRVNGAEGLVFDLRLCDIQAIPDNGEKLRLWAETAQEASLGAL